MCFHERIKQVRKALGFTQGQLAKEFNLKQRAISSWETGNSEPSMNALKIFCDRYKININWLLTGEGDMFIKEIRELPLHYKEAMRQNYNLTNEEVDLFIKELFESPTTRELCKKLLKAKHGNKEAMRDLENVISGLKMVYE